MLSVTKLLTEIDDMKNMKMKSNLKDKNKDFKM